MAAGAARSGWLTAGAELEAVLAAVHPEEIASLAAFLGDHGERVFFTGQGRSGLVARMAAMRFMHLGRDAHAVGEATSPSVRSGDTLVVISGSGSTPVSVSFARIASGVGARVALITWRRDSKIAALADTTLLLDTSGTAQFGGTLFEQAALIALDAVVADLAATTADAHAVMGANHTNLQ